MTQEIIVKRPKNVITGPSSRKLYISDEPTPIYFVGYLGKGWGNKLQFNVQHSDGSTESLNIDDKGNLKEEKWKYLNPKGNPKEVFAEILQEESLGDSFFICGYLDKKDAEEAMEKSNNDDYEWVYKWDVNYDDDEDAQLEIKEMLIPAGCPYFKVEESWEGPTEEIITSHIIPLP